jgi:hypothetical protein
VISLLKRLLTRFLRRFNRYVPEGAVEAIILHAATTISDDFARARRG